VSDALISRFADSPDTVVRQLFARALNNKAAALAAVGRVAESLDVWDAIVACFNEAAFDETVSMALLNKAGSLEELGRGDEALAVYAQTVERFADAAHPVVRAHLVRSLIAKHHLFARLGRLDDMVATSVEFADRFEAAPELAFRREAAAGLYGLGLGLMLSGRLDEALRAYDDVVRASSMPPSPRFAKRWQPPSPARA